MQMTMFHSLSTNNPVRRLLEPQSSYLIPFDDVLLLQWDASAPPTSIATGRQFIELIDFYAEGRELTLDEAVSLALGELIPDEDASSEVAAFLAWLKQERIAPQYILYAPDES